MDYIQQPMVRSQIEIQLRQQEEAMSSLQHLGLKDLQLESHQLLHLFLKRNPSIMIVELRKNVNSASTPSIVASALEFSDALSQF